MGWNCLGFRIMLLLFFHFGWSGYIPWALRRTVCLSTYSWRRETPHASLKYDRVSFRGCSSFAKKRRKPPPNTPKNADGNAFSAFHFFTSATPPFLGAFSYAFRAVLLGLSLPFQLPPSPPCLPPHPSSPSPCW